MDTFDILLKEVSAKQNFLIIDLIQQINLNIKYKLTCLFEEYKKTNNKYLFVSSLVKLGYELEKSFSPNSTDILSLQMCSISGLIKPIVSRIKKICYELNLELVDDLKKYVQKYIEGETLINTDIKKYIKFMNINCFCRNVNFVISKELMFEDYGIVVKITNPHYKNVFVELVESIGIFTQNNTKDKRFDWYWKALCDYNSQSQSKSPYFLTSQEECVLDEININKYKNMTRENNLPNNILPNNILPNNILPNDILNEVNETTIMEEFKIVQKIPENITGPIENKQNDKIKIIKQTNGESSKILSNSIIIEDESFSIPINDNNYNSSYTEYNN